MNKICGIYKITSPSNKIYIGQSRNINNRISFYKNHICYGQEKLYNSLAKYGWENHVFEIICECEENELNNLEEYYIKYYDSFNTKHGMNLRSGGNSNKLSEETKLKISNSTKNRVVSNETKEKMSNARKGIKLSDITKRKIGEYSKGNKYCLGRILNEETKRKIGKKNTNNYEIYNNENELIVKFSGNIKLKLKELNLPRNSLCNTYRINKKIKQGKHAGWYMIKISNVSMF